LDTDNRLTVPAEIQEDYRNGLYVTRGFDRNIMLLTIQAFESIYERITSLNLADPLARLLLRMILGTAFQTTISSDGKIPMPSLLKEFASLENDVVLVGQGDFVEVWSPRDWDRQEQKLSNAEADLFSGLNVTTRQLTEHGGSL
jgi:MraZ protein